MKLCAYLWAPQYKRDWDLLEQAQYKLTKTTITGTEAYFIEAGAESQRARTVQPGEKKTRGYIITVYINLMGRHEGAFCLQDE